MPELAVELPWIVHQDLGNLRVRRAGVNVLRYEDEIELAVVLVDPSEFGTLTELLDRLAELDVPGSVVLVAGKVPLQWRSKLRSLEVSFVDVSGVAEISWPRVRVSAGQFARATQRRRAPLPMQKGHALVTQSLLIAALDGDRPTVGELAERSGVGSSTASRAVSQLASHGLVAKHRDGSSVRISVADPFSLAEVLAQRTAWPHGQTISGYRWGRNVWEIASSMSDSANRAGIELSLTGRSALAFLGVLGTSSPTQTRFWVSATGDGLVDVAQRLGLEPTSVEDSNVVIAADPWGVGTTARSGRVFEDWQASVAHPIRVWCDVSHENPRGEEFAAQLWMEIQRRG